MARRWHTRSRHRGRRAPSRGIRASRGAGRRHGRLRRAAGGQPWITGPAGPARADVGRGMVRDWRASIARRSHARRRRVGQPAADRCRTRECLGRLAGSRGKARAAVRPSRGRRGKHDRWTPGGDRQCRRPLAMALSRRRERRRVHCAVGRYIRLAGGGAAGSAGRRACRCTGAGGGSDPVASRERSRHVGHGRAHVARWLRAARLSPAALSAGCRDDGDGSAGSGHRTMSERREDPPSSS